MHWFKHSLLVAFVTATLLVLLSAQLQAANGIAESDPIVERDVIARLNAWRISENLPPMKFNAELQALALKQARFLAGMSELPHGGDLHIDDKGNLPPQRANISKWPAYGIAARTAIGENAAVGDAKFALRYWLHSEIHKKTALNPAYREVGVAAVPFHKDFMIIAVFGARPDVLPAFLFPEEGTIYFTNEQYKFKSGGKWIQNVTTIQLYDENGKALLEVPSPFVEKMTLPPLTTENIEVAYQNGTTITRYKLNVRNDIAILPHHQATAGITLVPTTGATAILPTSTKPARLAPPTNTPRFQAPPTNTPRSIAAANTPVPTALATTLPTESAASILETPDKSPELMILYDDDSLVIVNDTDNTADISDLSLRYQARVLDSAKWAAIIPVPLQRFPADHCLMLEVATAKLFLPEACKQVRSVLTLNPERRFWMVDSFEVWRGDKLLGVCAKEEPGEEDHCEIAWR